MKTLDSSITILEKMGFKTQFIATDTGIRSLTTNRIYDPTETVILNTYTIPQNIAVAGNDEVYVIETKNGERGTLINAYGADHDINVSTFINKVHSLMEKTGIDHHTEDNAA